METIEILDVRNRTSQNLLTSSEVELMETLRKLPLGRGGGFLLTSSEVELMETTKGERLHPLAENLLTSSEVELMETRERV